MIIEPRPAVDGDVVRLVADLAADHSRRYGGPPAPVPVDTSFMVAMVGSTVAGCGAITPIDERAVELSRMFVRPEYRGRGVGRRLLGALEALAVSGGRTTVRLEAG